MNQSNHNKDSRRVEQVLLEKAVLGALPTHFKIEGDPRLHPVKFFEHPHLSEIHFTDNSVSQVTPTKLTEQAIERVGPVPTEATNTYSGIDYSQIELDEPEEIESYLRDMMNQTTVESEVETQGAGRDAAARPVVDPSDVPALNFTARRESYKPSPDNPYAATDANLDYAKAT